MNIINRVLFKLGYVLKSIRIINKYPYTKHYSIFKSNFSFWISDEIAKAWYEDSETSNTKECDLLMYLFDADDKILEIGTHYGWYSVFLSKQLSPKGSYSVVEMVPKAVMNIQANFFLNNLSNNKIYHAAGASKPGKIHFDLGFNGNANGQIKENYTASIEIEAITGDQIAAERGYITFLKIDVEGFEADVLEGCQKILSTIPKIALELHLDLLNNFGKSVKDVFKYINIDKYEGFYLSEPFNINSKPIVFDINNLPTNGKLNIFLKPKINAV